MSSAVIPASTRRHGIRGALLTMGVGLLLWFLPVGLPWDRFSYDLPFLFKGKVQPDELVVIHLDDQSAEELRQNANDWDRAKHADLVNRLTADGARLVVFDISFRDEGPTNSDRLFAEAMQRNGRVVLAAVYDEQRTAGVSATSPNLPLPILRGAAGHWGVSAVEDERPAAIRRYLAGTESEPSLVWEAARVADAPVTRRPDVDLTQHWLNYYGPPGALRQVRYADALKRQPPGYFTNKFVFIGSQPKTPYAFGDPDEFPTPYTRWGRGYSPGVDLAATAFLNLWQKEWLKQASGGLQLVAMLAAGLLCGYGLAFFRPATAGGLAGLAAALITITGVATALWLRVWWSWAIIAGAQIPCALIWAWFCHYRTALGPTQVPASDSLPTMVEPIGAPRPSGQPVPGATAPVPAGVMTRLPTVSDHTLIRCVGRGAYGEVWLARDVIGSFHAVKIVYRSSFHRDEPFEREFRGIEQYTPISRTHAGWVHVLHVGRNQAEGYFFYVMELGDDETTGTQVVPDTYQPRNLARDLHRRGALPLGECVGLGVALTDALDHLHQHQLIHRDIKPSNVIFVQGRPKFADIGMVTGLKTAEKDVSYLGTEGYIAPEGPGTPAADVYSLGKLLYEASTGRDRQEFPELPTAVLDSSEDSPALRLADIIEKACAEDPAERYASAAEMQADLVELQSRITPEQSGKPKAEGGNRDK